MTRRPGPFDKLGMPLRQLHEQKPQAHDEIAHLEIAAEVDETADLAGHHKRLDLPLQAIGRGRAGLSPRTTRAAFDQSLDLDAADHVGDPVSGVRLTGAQEDLRRGLRQHHFGVVTVARLELAPALEAEDHGIVRFPVFRDRGVQLGQLLEARELIEHKPHGPRMGLALVHEPQHEQVQP